MIWSSRAVKLGVVLASVGAHGLAAFMIWGNPEIQIEGGAEAAVQARLGNSFAELEILQVGSDTVVTMTDGTTLTLNNLLATNVTVADFV